MKSILKSLSVIALSGIALASQADSRRETNGLSLTPTPWESVPGWQNANPATGLLAFAKSCDQIGGKPSGQRLQAFWPDKTRWQASCNALRQVDFSRLDAASAKQWLQQNFKVYQARVRGSETGKFTGYFAYGLEASRQRGGPYQHPIYGVPKDLVRQGSKWYRKDQRGRLVQYYTRSQIMDGAIANTAPVLYWAKDAADVFFLHIQGSGQITLPDGGTAYVGFAGRNGHDFTAVGRLLVDSGKMAKKGASMQSIRQYLRDHPREGNALMRRNASYIFFRELPGGPVGAMGVELTPKRSLAADPFFWPYGLPVWVNIGQVNRLMVVQDTGADIRGPIRGDFYWGAGAAAEANAGPMNFPGRWYVILPSQTQTTAAPITQPDPLGDLIGQLNTAPASQPVSLTQPQLQPQQKSKQQQPLQAGTRRYNRPQTMGSPVSNTYQQPSPVASVPINSPAAATLPRIPLDTAAEADPLSALIGDLDK